MRHLVRILLCVTFAVTARGQNATPASTPFPPQPFDFTGSWDCTGAFVNGKTHHTTFQGAMVLGGKWLQLQEQDVEPKTGYLATYLIGYDPQQKKLVEFDASNFGAAVYTSADGWRDKTLTLTSPISSDAAAPYAANRFTYTILQAGSFSVDWQISRTADLNWKTADHFVCKRRP